MKTGRKPEIDIKQFHTYLYNYCDRNGKLVLTTQQLAEHYNVPLYIISNNISKLSKAGLIITTQNKQKKGNIKNYYIMPWDEQNFVRVNDGNSLDVLKEVDRTVQKMIDYFFTEKNECIPVDEYGIRYTGLDEITEKLLYGDLCALKEYLEDFNEFIEFKKLERKDKDA